MRRIIAILCVALIAGFSAVSNSKASEILDGMNDIKKGHKSGDYDLLVDGIERIAYYFKDFLASKNRTTSKVNSLANDVVKAMKIYNQEPMVLEDIADSIKRDTKKIDTKQREEVEYVNPFDQSIASSLASDNVQLRREGLKELRANIAKQRDVVRSQLNHTATERNSASAMLSVANADERRGRDIENVLNNAFNSSQGLVLSAVSNQFGYMLIDMMLYVNPALTQRKSSCIKYLERVNQKHQALESKFARLDNYDKWASYYQWELSMKFPTDEFEKSIALLNDLERLQGKIVDQKSVEARRIQQLTEITRRETQTAKDHAAELVKYARFKDANVARIEAYANLYNLGASLGGGVKGTGSGKGQTVVDQKTTVILIQYESMVKQQPTLNRARPNVPPPISNPKIELRMD